MFGSRKTWDLKDGYDPLIGLPFGVGCMHGEVVATRSLPLAVQMLQYPLHGGLNPSPQVFRAIATAQRANPGENS